MALFEFQVKSDSCRENIVAFDFFPLSQRYLLISQLLFINASLSFPDLSAVNGESCDAPLGPSSATTGDVLPPADDHEDCTQDATLPESNTAPNSTSQPLPTSTQAPASSSSSSSSAAAKPTDGAAAAAAAPSTLTSPAQGATAVTTSSSSSSLSPALGEANASGGAGGSSSNSATADGAKPRQQAPNAGAADPLPPG